MHNRLRTRTLPGLILAACLAGTALPVAAADYGVQVGAFTDPDNAERLRLRLLNQGYDPVQVLPLVSGSRDYSAVVVGRLPNQAEAAGLLNRLRGSFRSGFIRPLPEPAEPETAAPAAPGPATEQPAATAVIAPAPSRPAAPAPSAEPDSDVYQDWSGYAALETRVFPRDGRFPDQHDGPDLSLAFEPEYYREWDNGDQSFVFRPFLRLDQQDDERTHFDIRELAWIRAAEDWELRVGVRRVFWGVTETVHLVDIINQIDLVENTDTEDRLGQPMINLALIRDWGTLDLFVLPGFRPRTFPGPDGRLRTEPWVDTEQVEYESGARHLHTDAAVRWSRYFGPFDIGVAHFWGTGRDPILQPGTDGAGNPVLIPFYPIINQTSLDLQATMGGWLWKLEWLTRGGQDERFEAAAGGFEYTLYGILDSRADLGLLAEYLYDSRGDDAPTLFQDDLMLGLRWTPNDVHSTELLFGVVFDEDGDQRFYNLEASRRFGSQWKLSLEARATSNLEASDTFGSIRDDDYLQMEFAYYY